MDEFDKMIDSGRSVVGAGPAGQAAPSGLRAEDTTNAAGIEQGFVIKAVEHSDVYWRLLGCLPPSSLKFTKQDDAIFLSFQNSFPELFERDHAGIRIIDEDAMKSVAGKAKWRTWCMQWEKLVEDYNFGTLERVDCREEYTEQNTIFLVRIQFYAFEIARNRLGLNDKAHELAKKDSAPASS